MVISIKRARFGGIAFLAVVVSAFFAAPAAEANCISDVTPVSGEAMDLVFFPNWTKAYASAFQPFEYAVDCGTSGCLTCHPGAGDTCGGANFQVAGLTIVNFGTAVAVTDITAVYWLADLSNVGGGLTWHTMTSVAPNMWTWAWNGAETNPTLVTKSGVGEIKVYVDIAGTPTDDRTIQMGIPYDPGGYGGGLSDMCCCNASWADIANPIKKTIKYVTKFVDKISAAPGDTLNYSIYYGKPGVGNIQNVFIMDTQPPYTHWNGVSNPLPDPGWDPNPGPPLKLGWTVFPASTPVAGGATGKITFQLTIDWGNGEWFEPGSGDVAAPENYSLWNNVMGTFNNIAQKVHFGNKTRTTVMRFLFWKVADRDVVYNCTPTTCDEITYSIFIKNLSASKTWWDVRIWDTCPTQVNPWGPDCGIEDPCAGWTMTPTGCAIAGAGWVLNGVNTILTWKLDMQPQLTLTLRWKAKVSSSAIAGQIAINKASILEYGRTTIIEGTGHSITARNFTHKAPVILRTTYVSYVAYNNTGDFGCGSNSYYYISLYVLHPSLAFQLFRLYETSCTNGVRPSISTLAPPYPCNSWPGGGCPIGVERRPQLYGFDGAGNAMIPCVAGQFHYYKLVSNSPLLWEVQPTIGSSAEDSTMYATATTLTFRGNTLYTYRRTNLNSPDAINGDYLGIANTENMPTTIHMFQWDGSNLDWSYRGSRTIDPLSQWMTGGTPAVYDGHWRIISSDSDLIVWKGYAFPALTDYDNVCTMAPAAPTGNLIADGAGEEFWVYAGRRTPVGGASLGHNLVLSNLGTADATFQMFKYIADDFFDIAGATPNTLGGASGTWQPLTSGTIPAGQQQLAAPFNPYMYGRATGGEPVDCKDFTDFNDDYQLVRVRLTSAGQPVQIKVGHGGPERYGGFVLHGIDSLGAPAQTGAEWWHSHFGGQTNSNASYVSFCSSKDMVVRVTSENGFTATYTTTGPDQPVVHCGVVGETPIASCGTNFRFQVLSPVGKRMIAVVCGSYFTERHYSCPFLSTGTHYEILVPPTVFVGQSFWITVVVLDTGGGTKTDYTGTTSFSSTDPTAKIQATNMDTYNYTWLLANAGVKIFINVTMNTLGLINIVAGDVLDGSITGMATVMVVGADVKLEKRKKLSVAASGDTVTFQVCWSNYSSATANTFVITDAVPNGTTYVPEVASLALCGWNGPAQPTVTMAYSASTATIPSAVTFTTLGAASSAASTARWLRWTVRDIYVFATGCVCFKVTVD